MNLLLKVDKEAYAEHPQYAHAQQKGEVSQILLDLIEQNGNHFKFNQEGGDRA